MHWRLLTTHRVATLADALQITRFYRQRWTIEQLFRVMKTKGFDIEAVRVAEDGPFENLTTATLIAAIQVLQMVRGRDGAAGRPLEDAVPVENQIRTYSWCNPPRIGRQRMRPALFTVRDRGASLSKAKCVRVSL